MKTRNAMDLQLHLWRSCHLPANFSQRKQLLNGPAGISCCYHDSPGLFSTISPAAAPWVAANKHSNKSKMTSAGVEMFVVLTVPQKAHPREEHTTNRGDIKTKVIYYNRYAITGLPSSIPQSCKTLCPESSEK